MTNYTTFLGLYKPDKAEGIEVESIAQNFEAIDSKIGAALSDGTSTYENLNERLNMYENRFDNVTERNVMDFGAKGDGVTDDTQAFHDAMADGGYVVTVPAGVFRTSGLFVPSNTMLVGAGKKRTVIKLLDETPVGHSVLTNSDYTNGNENIYVGHLTLDWNKDTRPAGWKIPKGPTSSCLLLRMLTILLLSMCLRRTPACTALIPRARTITDMEKKMIQLIISPTAVTL